MKYSPKQIEETVFATQQGHLPGLTIPEVKKLLRQHFPEISYALYKKVGFSHTRVLLDEGAIHYTHDVCNDICECAQQLDLLDYQ